MKRLYEELSVMKTLARNEWSSYYSIIEYLRQHHYKAFRTGSYSEVFTKHTEKFVVKVTHRPDPAWLHFVDIARQHQGNRHLPKVSRVIDFKDTLNDNSNNSFIAFVEKLEPLSVDNDDINYLASYMVSILQGNTCSYYWRYWITGNSKQEQMAKEFADSHPDFVKTIQMIIQNKGEFRLDLHDGNIMLRPGTNTFVIIDPYAV